MKLHTPFCRLPIRFDVERLQTELAAMQPSDWRVHPTGFKGNSAVRLITVEGGENDDFIGRMAPTSQMQRTPYIRQLLAGFGVVWSRSRLMRLAPGARVPEHCDVNYHWFHRVRLHIPIQTDPAVSFTSGGETVHMAAGEAWLFDNWRMHEVYNGSPRERVHLVADTAGSAAFWMLAGAGQTKNFERWPGTPPAPAPYRADAREQPMYEQINVPAVMHPSEVEQLTIDLLADLRPPRSEEERKATEEFSTLASGFCREWRQFWSLFADGDEGLPHYLRLRDYAAGELARFKGRVFCASNGMDASEIWYPRVLLYACQAATRQKPVDVDRTLSSAPAVVAKPARPRLRAPVFIVSAPRSGSTLLFETLARAHGFSTVGGESHWLVESLPQLQPWAPGVGSNRLTATHVNEAVRSHIFETLLARLQDRDGQPVTDGEIRFLEKTPKNSLRIPFFEALFPDARFIYLHRDPRENLGSIIDAWQSGGWVTYPDLPGWGGAWSLLLPPDWQTLRGKPLEEIAAYQWARTNEIVMDDLARLAPERWTHVGYDEFLADPLATVQRLTDFAGIDFDDELAASLTQPLPLSAHTLAPPEPDKWRRHEDAILRVLPSVQAVQARIDALPSASVARSVSV